MERSRKPPPHDKLEVSGGHDAEPGLVSQALVPLGYHRSTPTLALGKTHNPGLDW